ncbi:MAG: PDZ domain-containing protein, partial [Anaerolineales bacterium]|nr:PDZ domain-containing protein [Anaerolineales bacterium]
MDWVNIIFWLIGTLIVVLGPIILIHELGHFFAAKLVGVRVEEFGLGFPPRILHLWRERGYLQVNDTRIAIPNAMALPPDLQVGGQVAVLARRGEDNSFTLRRIRAIQDSERVVTESPTAPPDIRLRGELKVLEPGTLYSLNLLPIGAFVRMTGEEDPSDPRSLSAQPKRSRIGVLAAGAAVNILAAALILSSAYLSGVPEHTLVQVTEVQPGSAAEAAGLLANDVIIEVSGKRLEDGL